MDTAPLSTKLTAMVTDVVAHATGRRERANPVAAPSGGPAGNALLTAWTGLALLVLSVAELLTLLDVRGLITWHVIVGALLVPPAVLKTVTTGWRIVRYYQGDRAYQAAGPPPTLLRALGPLVVLTTLALLGTGVLLILVGEPSSRAPLVTVLGYGSAGSRCTRAHSSSGGSRLDSTCWPEPCRHCGWSAVGPSTPPERRVSLSGPPS